MKMEQSFFEEEVRHGFYINPMMKRGWAAQMEVLQGVDDICRKYNIRWFSHYGTMLGAVRHGGFVPWDDDMDICMLREDYDRFAEAIKKENTELRLYGMGDDCDKDDFTNLIARVLIKLRSKNIISAFMQAVSIFLFWIMYRKIKNSRRIESNWRHPFKPLQALLMKIIKCRMRFIAVWKTWRSFLIEKSIGESLWNVSFCRC